MSALAGLRRRAGYTQEEFVEHFAAEASRLGIRATVSVRQLRRWEGTDPPLPHPGQQQVLEALLGVPLEEMGFPVPDRRRSGTDWSQAGAGMGRRAFLVDVGAVTGAEVVRAPARHGSRVGVVQVSALTQSVNGLYGLDHARGGLAARAAALRLLAELDQTLTEGTYTERIGRDLHSLLGTVHAHLGWLEFDAGRPSQARRSVVEAMASARLTGDVSMEIRTLDSLSLLSVEGRRPWEAVAAASAAVEFASRHAGPRVRSAVFLRQARAFGAATDHAAARRALSAALMWQERSEADSDAPAWTRFAGQVEIDYATAAHYALAGQPSAAVPFLRAAVDALGPAFARNAALYRARLAQALLQAGEVEEACTQMGRVLDASTSVSSARLGQRLAKFGRAVASIDTGCARDLTERLSTAGRENHVGDRAR